jgi:hypothetical protein
MQILTTEARCLLTGRLHGPASRRGGGRSPGDLDRGSSHRAPSKVLREGATLAASVFYGPARQYRTEGDQDGEPPGA